MTPINLKKALEYLKIQESLQSENFSGYHYVKEYFYMFYCTLKDIIQVQSETNHWISKNLMIICLKGISEECFSFNVNVNASLKFLWALGGLSQGTTLEHSEGT